MCGAVLQSAHHLAAINNIKVGSGPTWYWMRSYLRQSLFSSRKPAFWPTRSLSVIQVWPSFNSLLLNSPIHLIQVCLSSLEHHLIIPVIMPATPTVPPSLHNGIWPEQKAMPPFEMHLVTCFSFSPLFFWRGVGGTSLLFLVSVSQCRDHIITKHQRFKYSHAWFDAGRLMQVFFRVEIRFKMRSLVVKLGYGRWEGPVHLKAASLQGIPSDSWNVIVAFCTAIHHHYWHWTPTFAR